MAYPKHHHEDGSKLESSFDAYASLLGLDPDEATRYYGDCLLYMDDNLREELNAELAPCSEEIFLIRYSDAHRKKFNELFYWDKN